MGTLIPLAAARLQKQARIAAWYARCAEELALHGVWPEYLEDFEGELERYRRANLDPREASERLLRNLGVIPPDDHGF